MIVTASFSIVSSPTYAAREQERKVLFIGGFQLIPDDPLIISNNELYQRFLKEKVNPQLGWEDIESFPQNHPFARALNLQEDDFLYFSYSGKYEKDDKGRDDYTRPDYERGDTYFGTDSKLYDDRAKIIDGIINAFPTEVKFDIIGHSLGGVVATYWAATKTDTDPLLRRVNGVITLDSPLQGRAGACGVTLPIYLIPEEVVQALPSATRKTSLFTIRNEFDKVVAHDKATIDGVWRDLVIDNPGDAGVNPCSNAAHSIVRNDERVKAHIVTAMNPGKIIGPTANNPRFAGTYDDPSKIMISVTYPKDATYPKVKRQLTPNDFTVYTFAVF